MLEGECPAVDASCGEGATSKGGVDEDGFFKIVSSVLISRAAIVTVNWRSGNELKRAFKVPDIKGVFVQLNKKIPISSTVKHLFGKPCKVFSNYKGSL